MAAEEGGELVLLAVECHVIEDYGFHEEVDVVGGGAAGGFDVAARAHVADLLVATLFIADGGGVSSAATDEGGATAGIVDKEKGAGGLLIVAGPDAFAASGDGIVGHAIAEDRAITKHVDH